MKKSFKKAMLAGLSCIMAMSMTACSGNANEQSPSSKATPESSQSDSGDKTAAASAGDKKVIKLFHRFPDDPCNSFIEKKAAEYEAAHPDIDIQITSAQNQPYKEKIKVVVGSDECPDIFFSWGGEFSERFIRENLILDLTQYMEKDTAWKDSLLPTQMVEYTTDEGMIYGVPFRLDGKLFFYNKDIFEKEGLKIPKTWDEFLTLCDKLKADGITPIAEGNQDQWPACHYVGTLNQMLVADDVRAKDYNPKTGEFTDPGYVKALEYYKQLVPYMNAGVNGQTHDMARLGFTQGQTAMLYAELVEITNVKQENKDLNWGMFHFPIVEGSGNTDLLSGSPEGFVVSSKTKYPDECVQFLKWFLGPEVGAAQAEEVGWFNASKGVDADLKDPSLIDAYKAISSAKEMGPWFDSSLYSTVCDTYLTAISDITNEDVTPAEAMKKVQAAAKEAQSLIR
ncbi:ABC transporter substrate-binding protein [Lacrimispora sp.]|uniref:ABC transporter substrate-binding protein n=1 Tax=Lacrimispora sp. TaxID=2719234 RepID=UPI0028AD3DC9|nr:extracellular solute-binding protein [Lacrimispora sp.]